MPRIRLPNWPAFRRLLASAPEDGAKSESESKRAPVLSHPRMLPRSIGFTFAGLSLAALTGFFYQILALRRDLRRYPPPGRLVDVGGFRLHMQASGSKRPTVVLDSGSGGSSLDWAKIQPELAKLSRVCSYDRAGHGWSEVGRHPHTIPNVVQDLHVLLQVAREPAPFILVGHSLGGLYAQYFARTYPKQVAGLVLIDASPAEIYDYLPVGFHQQTRGGLHRRYLSATFGLMRLGLLREEPASTSEIDRARSMLSLRPGFWQTALKQNRHLGPGVARQFEEAGPFPPIPLIVITPAHATWLASIHPDLPEQWLAAQARLADLSPKGRLVVVEDGGHDLLKDHPSIVIDAVKDILAQVQGVST